MDVSQRKEKPVVIARVRDSTSGRGAKVTHRPPGQLKGKALKPKRWQVRASHSILTTGAQLLAKGPRLYWRTSCIHQSATRPALRGDVLGCFGRACLPVLAMWVAQAHSHVFSHIRTRCLIREIEMAYVHASK
jgi:hypothetical protein